MIMSSGASGMARLRRSEDPPPQLQSLKPSIKLGFSSTGYPEPGWRNWQTQRTQNPPVLSTLGVRLPLPAPIT